MVHSSVHFSALSVSPLANHWRVIGTLIVTCLVATGHVPEALAQQPTAAPVAPTAAPTAPEDDSSDDVEIEAEDTPKAGDVPASEPTAPSEATPAQNNP